MPRLEISMPPVTVEIRRDLVQRLTNVFDEATSFGRYIFAVRFHEYQPGSTAIGGDLLSDAFPACAESQLHYELPGD